MLHGVCACGQGVLHVHVGTGASMLPGICMWPGVCMLHSACPCGQGVHAASSFVRLSPAQVGLWPSGGALARELSSRDRPRGGRPGSGSCEQAGQGAREAGLVPRQPLPCLSQPHARSPIALARSG